MRSINLKGNPGADGEVIRKYDAGDWPAVWRMIEPVLRAGETYAFPRDISEADAHKAWVDLPLMTFVAEDERKTLLGTYYLKPNQSGPGEHVCNCGYIVAEEARGQGVAAAMCQHSQAQALSHGFLAMQYNLVVSTNQGAIRLWKRQGFQVIGLLPKAFNHPLHGLVDAMILYKWLAPDGASDAET